MKAYNQTQYGPQIVTIITIALFVPNFGQYLLSPFAGEIINTYHISESQFSTLFTAPMIPAVFLSFLTGMLVDRFSSKLVIGIALAISTVGAVLSFFAETYSILFIAFILLGFTAAALNGTQAKLLSGWYPPEKVSSKTGVVLSGSTIAMGVALATAALFPSMKAAFLTTAAFALISFILWIIFYREPCDGIKKPSYEKNRKGNLSTVIKNISILVIGLCMFMLMAANVVMSSFLPILLGSRGLSSKNAGYYSSIYMIGCFISCYLSPWVLEKWQNVKKAILFWGVLGIIGTVFVALQTKAGVLLGVTVILAGIGIGGNIPLLMGLPVTLDGIGSKHAGTAGGLIATFQLLGAIIVPSYILIPIAGDGNYIMLFSLAGLCILFCILLIFLLPGTVRKRQL